MPSCFVGVDAHSCFVVAAIDDSSFFKNIDVGDPAAISLYLGP